MELEAVRELLLKRAAAFKTKRANSLGRRAWAKHHGVLNSRVSEFLSGKRLPNDDILNALGLEWRIVRKRPIRALQPAAHEGEGK